MSQTLEARPVVRRSSTPARIGLAAVFAASTTSSGWACSKKCAEQLSGAEEGQAS